MTQNKLILPIVVDSSTPTVTDDKNAGFIIGMLWLTATSLYVCTGVNVGAAVWTVVGGGGGGGVSSVALSLPSFITVTGSPITTAGTLTGTLADQVKNTVFVGPSTGADAAPTFRILAKEDVNSALNSALLGGTNVDITDNGDGTFTITATEVNVVDKSADYTLVLADKGKLIRHPSSDTTARTFTIPSNASVAFPIGTAISFLNEDAAGIATIAINSDTLKWVGTAGTGSRALAPGGMATAIKVASTLWWINGAGLT